MILFKGPGVDLYPTLPELKLVSAMPPIPEPKLDTNSATTMRLTAIYISKKCKGEKDWKPSIETLYNCYEYINDMVKIKIGMDENYIEYFLTTPPEVVHRDISDEISRYVKLKCIAERTPY